MCGPQIWESYVPPKAAEEGAANGNGNAVAPGEAAEPVVISYARAAEDFFVQVHWSLLPGLLTPGVKRYTNCVPSYF